MKEIKLEDHERQRCEIWSRVMGYLRPSQIPVSGGILELWNPGKIGERDERRKGYFKEPKL